MPRFRKTLQSKDKEGLKPNSPEYQRAYGEGKVMPKFKQNNSNIWDNTLNQGPNLLPVYYNNPNIRRGGVNQTTGREYPYAKLPLNWDERIENMTRLEGTPYPLNFNTLFRAAKEDKWKSTLSHGTISFIRERIKNESEEDQRKILQAVRYRRQKELDSIKFRDGGFVKNKISL